MSDSKNPNVLIPFLSSTHDFNYKNSQDT